MRVFIKRREEARVNNKTHTLHKMKVVSRRQKGDDDDEESCARTPCYARLSLTQAKVDNSKLLVST